MIGDQLVAGADGAIAEPAHGLFEHGQACGAGVFPAARREHVLGAACAGGDRAADEAGAEDHGAGVVDGAAAC